MTRLRAPSARLPVRRRRAPGRTPGRGRGTRHVAEVRGKAKGTPTSIAEDSLEDTRGTGDMPPYLERG